MSSETKQKSTGLKLRQLVCKYGVSAELIKLPMIFSPLDDYCQAAESSFIHEMFENILNTCFQYSARVIFSFSFVYQLSQKISVDNICHLDVQTNAIMKL